MFWGESDRDREKRRLAGGGGGIRTPGALSGPTVFKTAGFNRSPTPPFLILAYSAGRGLGGHFRGGATAGKQSAQLRSQVVIRWCASQRCLRRMASRSNHALARRRREGHRASPRNRGVNWRWKYGNA